MSNLEEISALGAKHRMSGEYEKAIFYFQQAANDHIDDPWPLIQLGITYRDFGKPYEAVSFFEKALDINPEHVNAHLEIAYTTEKISDVNKSIHHLILALKYDPNSSIARHELAVRYRKLGKQNELDDVLDFTPTDDNKEIFDYTKRLFSWKDHDIYRDVQDLAIDCDYARLGKFLNECIYHKKIESDILIGENSSYIRAHIEDDTLIRDTEYVNQAIKSAIDEKRPFSLIRLADGEGALLSYIDAMAYPLCPASNFIHANVLGQEIWNTWLGKKIQHENLDDLIKLRNGLFNAVENADVVGIPKIMHAIDAISYIEHHGCVHAHKFVRSIRSHGLTVPQINAHLKNLDVYDYIMKSQKDIGIITCHSSLGQRIESKYEKLKVRSYIIPYQHGHGEIFKYDKPVESHFPDIYNEIIGNIKVPHRGYVYLVAAGAFGKVYCDKIKRNGGIAIDIGAVADALAGFNTRESMKDLIE
ncbi:MULTISPECIES: hypothetical protein [Methylobacterium]|uniref:Flp pilus assembly protein TadD, contains TPR repeats n=2 Tax=Methylobacterium TaxID=407 RepID=A0A0C6FPB1_9HYPH|nr:hypothetical protein [Methylobacterium aquaticum]BAQ50163.1 Flp pilus assembly protein TadD, contains TPR repeats [Methylobacterium aquaticum]